MSRVEGMMRRTTIAAIAVIALAADAVAQGPPNLPPPGSYAPIPNYTGVGAGLQFRKAINDRFSGAQPIVPAISGITFSILPIEQDGSLFYCKDCRSTTPCVNGGAGAWALGARGQWSCAAGALEANLNANGNRLTNLGSASAAGDAIAFGQAGGQLNTLSGARLDGSDAISNFSVNGVKNIRAFGASGSLVTASATAAANSATVTVNAIGDFKVGQWIKLDHAGAASNANPPTGVTVVPNSYGLNPNPTSDITKPSNIGGGCHTDSATTVPGHNTNCTTTYIYQIVGVSSAGAWSAPTAQASTSVGPAVLSTNNNLLVSWTGAANDVGYLIYSCAGASCTPTLHAVVPHAGAPGATAESYRDFGHAFGTDDNFGTTLQSGAEAQDLFAQITAINGTSVVLSTAPAQTGTFTLRHDDSVAVNAAISSICSHSGNGGANGGIVQFPAAATYPIGQTIDLYGCFGVTLSLAASNGDGGNPVDLEWHGAAGGIVISMNKAADCRVEGLTVSGKAGTTAGVIIDVDNYTTGGAGDAVPTQHDIFERLELGRSGIGVRVANRSSANVQNMTFRNVQVSNPSNGQGGMWGYFFGGAGQTYNEEIHGGLIQGRDVGIVSGFVGQLEVYGTNFELDNIEFWDSNRLGGAADGNLLLKGITTEGAQYLIYDSGPSDNSVNAIEESRLADSPGPNGFVMNLTRRTLIENSYVCGTPQTVCGIANTKQTTSIHSEYADATPFRDGTGSNAPDSQQFIRLYDSNQATNYVGLSRHTTAVEGCSDAGTVTASATISFAKNSCQKITTATTGLTYTLSTTNVAADQVVTIESYIAGAIGAGPVWATSSGAIKWAGGSAPTSSNQNGFVDVIVLKWDGANWLEVSRSIGDH
ncbi:MAG TPA: hypothetical protein VEU51_09820 [Candidatus Acidoferrales bacterium]|nr:hypothetical protein [Candidatus Acidoferrales bacterium]